MRKNLTEIVFILDRSGSMSGLERDTIGGFNSMIEQQKKAEGEALISTVLFDNVSEVLHDRVNVKDIRPMTDRDYTVRGCTALLDAIGGAIHHIGNVHNYNDLPDELKTHKNRKSFLDRFKVVKTGGIILADEVGLGKTIEAGLVLNYVLDNGAKKVLISLPATLRKQWEVELLSCSAISFC